MHGQSIRLTRRLASKGFSPQYVAEVGVFEPETSNVYDYIKQGVRCMLVEPDPGSAATILEHFKGHDNITLHQVALYDRPGTIELVRRSASTFVRELPESPAIVNDDYTPCDDDTFTVETRTFDQLDDGAIDLLSVDTEGCEWFVIKHMVSRPAVISLETHGALYQNPYLADIRGWMRANDYVALYKTKTDTVFIRRAAVRRGVTDMLRLAWMSARVALRRYRKQVSRQLRRRPDR